jgi:hypothetical protein
MPQCVKWCKLHKVKVKVARDFTHYGFFALACMDSPHFVILLGCGLACFVLLSGAVVWFDLEA